MTRDAVTRGAQYVIWPESATPFMFEQDPIGQAELRALAREQHVPILFGSDQEVSNGTADPLLYNAAFLIEPTGQTAAVYRARVRGCLLGGAIGDALGYPIEFLSLDRIRTVHGERGVTGFVPGSRIA